MSDRFRALRGRPIVTAALALVVVAGLAAAGTATATPTKSCGTVTLNEQAWAGSTANTYVAKAALQKIGCKVNITKITEIPVYQAMANGKTDAVLEDWQHVDQYKQYITKQHTVVMGGPNGVIGHIGWFVPTYLMKKYPQFKTWRGLKGKESIFKSPESGSQGMFLGGDPSYVQKDAQLIQALGLNFKFVSVGAEPAQVARWSQLYKQHKAVIFYWYTPQYLNSAYQLSEIKLPPRGKNCVDSYSPKLGKNWSIYRCGYGQTIIEKLISSKFAKSGSPALNVIKKWHWTAADQNTVANQIAGKHVDPEKAAEAWVKANPAKVKAWLR